MKLNYFDFSYLGICSFLQSYTVNIYRTIIGTWPKLGSSTHFFHLGLEPLSPLFTQCSMYDPKAWSM